eukprot:CAMPEP_0118857084 /NCGR_PEP_ID=MMETSP1163-20130328/4330_1 /TAXON_ID=124430 /ORGANISM="Phaeomonas parva, Strain CCMP2877" /LENGTH=880 /DNA_ID=CAMNT_0006790337 /DNA_START=279 /DNA_END=2921 /DNA_ORIENTATION=+
MGQRSSSILPDGDASDGNPDPSAAYMPRSGPKNLVDAFLADKVRSVAGCMATERWRRNEAKAPGARIGPMENEKITAKVLDTPTTTGEETAVETSERSTLTPSSEESVLDTPTTTGEETAVNASMRSTLTPSWEKSKDAKLVSRDTEDAGVGVTLLAGSAAVAARGRVFRNASFSGKAASPLAAKLVGPPLAQRCEEEHKGLRSTASMHAKSTAELAQAVSHRKRLQDINNIQQQPGKSFSLQLPLDMRPVSEVAATSARPFPALTLRLDVGDTVFEASEDMLSPSPKHAALPSPTRPPPLALTTAEVVHDDDWISVDSDGEGFGDDDVMPARRGLPHNPMHASSPHPAIDVNMPASGGKDSWLFTQSGNVYVPFQATGGATIGPRGVVFGGDGAPPTPQANGGRAPLMPLTDRLVVLTKLGEGASADVYKCYDLEFQEIVAVKVVPLFNVAKRGQFLRELEALRSSIADQELLRESPSHYAHILEDTEGAEPPPVEAGAPFLLRFKDAFCNREEATIALTMEHMDGGSLQDIVDTGGLRQESTIGSIAYQVLLGLRLLHHKGQLHRDLKPANILMSRRGRVRISDFGVARNFKEDTDKRRKRSFMAQQQQEIAQTFVGTVTFMSPERMAGEGYGYSSDVWSFGLTILTLALGQMPMAKAQGYWSVLHAIRDEEPPSIPDDGSWSAEFRDFVGCCLKKEASERWTCDQLLCHPFLKTRASPRADDVGVTLSDQEYHAVVCDYLYTLDAIYMRIKSKPEEFDAYLKAKLRQLGREAHVKPGRFTVAEMFRHAVLGLEDDPLVFEQLDIPRDECVAITESVVSQIEGEEAEEASHDKFQRTWSGRPTRPLRRVKSSCSDDLKAAKPPPAMPSSSRTLLVPGS